MHGSSAELLLDRPLRKPTPEAPPAPPGPPRTCLQRLKFYVTSALAMAVSGGFAALLFLVPLYVDPAVSTLMSDFDPEAVTCETSQVEYLAGLGNCSWSSCREGCTSDLYRCTHVTVLYTPNSNHSEDELVNVRVSVFFATFYCSCSSTSLKYCVDFLSSICYLRKSDAPEDRQYN
jgi:hypothetical protein